MPVEGIRERSKGASMAEACLLGVAVAVAWF